MLILTNTFLRVGIVFNVNDYVDINEHIPSGGYNIYTLYDCYSELKRITPFIG